MIEFQGTPGKWFVADHISPHMSVVNAAGETVAPMRYRDGKGRCLADYRLMAAALDLLRYAQLEAEYTRLCDRRRPDYDGSELMRWVEANGIGNEPVGAWLGRIRTAAVIKALEG